MLTVGELLKLEEKYDDIYKTEILEHTFFWRELTQKEYEQATRLFNDEEDILEYICTTCVVKPLDFDFDNCYAGITNTLGKIILEQSGYVDGHGKRQLAYYRMQMGMFENQIVPIISAAFPSLNIEEVEKWTLNKQIRYLAMAEWTLIHVHGIPISIGEQTEPTPDLNDFPELRMNK